jgi:hypothetical protein
MVCRFLVVLPEDECQAWGGKLVGSVGFAYGGRLYGGLFLYWATQLIASSLISQEQFGFVLPKTIPVYDYIPMLGDTLPRIFFRWSDASGIGLPAQDVPS